MQVGDQLTRCLIATILGAVVSFCDSAGTVSGNFAMAQSLSTDELMKPGLLPDLAEGSSAAPVTVIEYASMTCAKCADFHERVYPFLKLAYIDTGKVRYIFREYPESELDVAASMIVRCTPEAQRFRLIYTLFFYQERWIGTGPTQELIDIAKDAGVDAVKCGSNEWMYNALTEARQHVRKQTGIYLVPAFFINGKLYSNTMTIEALEHIFKPFLQPR